MSGMIIRKFNSETGKYMKGFTSQLTKVIATLPKDYDEQVVLDHYKKFYPNHWSGLISRFNYYLAKDQHLVIIGKKKDTITRTR